MTNKFKFTLSNLAILVALGIYSLSTVAGEPKECVPLPREIYVTLEQPASDPASRANLCAEGFRYASWYEMKRCNETRCVYREDLGQKPTGPAGGYPHTPTGAGGALAETCWGYLPGKNYALFFVEFDYWASEFVLDQVVTPEGYQQVCEGRSVFWCISE